MLSSAPREHTKHGADLALVRSGKDHFVIIGLSDWGKAFADMYPGTLAGDDAHQIEGAARGYGLRLQRSA